MFKIGEFSRLAQVSARMLRYYDQCGLLHPDRVDHFTGYRLYSAAQLTDLARIVALRDMGFGVEEIAALLPCFGDAAAMGAALRKRSGRCGRRSPTNRQSWSGSPPFAAR